MVDITQDDITKAINYAESVHGADRGGHGIGHIRRVMDNARMIMNEVDGKYSRSLVLFCCALHDVDDKKLVSPGEQSRLNKFLLENEYPAELCDCVKDIISRVSFSENRGDDGDSLSLEAKIVRDSDRLDALGAVGIARAFAYGGKTDRPMFCTDGEKSSEQHFYDKLLILPSLMLTVHAAAEANRRVEFMREFIAELHSEIPREK